MDSQLKARDVRDTITRAFPFSIDKLPLRGPDNIRTDHYGLFKSDHDGDNVECVGPTVKRGYQPHTLDDVVALAEAGMRSFDDSHDARIKCHWSGSGHRVIIEPSDAYKRSVFGSNDNIYPRLIIKADFGRAFTASCGMWRDACDNLMMIRQVDNVTVKIRHTSSLREKMDELISDFRTVGGKFDNVYDLACKMQSQRVDVADFVAKLYPVNETASKRSQRAAERRAAKIVSRMLRERIQTNREESDIESGSLWEVTQAVLGYVQHDKNRNGKPSPIGRAMLGLDDVETSAAWNLALTHVA